MRAKGFLVVSCAVAVVAAVLVGVGLAAVPTPESPGPNPPPGYRLDQVTYDTEGHPAYGYVRADYQPPAGDENEAGALAADNYCDQLLTLLGSETPYDCWKVVAVPVGAPTCAPPLTFETATVYVWAERAEAIPAVRAIATTALRFDPHLTRMIVILCAPKAMYGEVAVYAADLPGIDWEKAAQELQQKGRAQLGERGQIVIN